MILVTKIMSLAVKLEEFCKEHDVVLISPVSKDTDHIIQFGESGKLELTSVEEIKGLKTRSMNASAFCNMERKAVEQCHAAIKQDKFLTHTIHWTYLRPIHVSMLGKIQNRLQ